MASASSPWRLRTPTACARQRSDGRLWELWFTAVPEPDKVDAYITTALDGQKAGHMLPWVVREVSSGKLIGSTRYHDVVAPIDRVEIGYTWYAKRWQRHAREHGVQAVAVRSTRSRRSAAPWWA